MFIHDFAILHCKLDVNGRRIGGDPILIRRVDQQ